MKTPPTYNMKQAQELGFASITVPYSKHCKTEQRYLANVLRDMVGVRHCLIETGYGIEVGRLRIELK
jgi:hypothetical protein